MYHPLRGNGSATPRWPSFRGKSHRVGVSPSGMVTVFVDPSLGAPGLQNAQDLLHDADRVVAANNAIFGKPGGPVNVIIFAIDGQTDGTGGADHMGCDFVTGANIEVCAAFGSPQRVSGLFEAELSECSMNGSLCGVSTGEALSRWCAAETSGNALADFASAPQWAQDGMPDFVNRTDPTDRNEDSTGCGMAFLSFLMSQGFGLERIAPQMVALGDSGTLAQLFANLTGRPASEALPTFLAAIQALPAGITSDDPFGAFQPAETAILAASKAGQIFAAIFADVQAGRSAEQIAARVRSILPDGAPALTRTACSIRSHRLRPGAEVKSYQTSV
jgi:hypothetical protein